LLAIVIIGIRAQGRRTTDTGIAGLFRPVERRIWRHRGQEGMRGPVRRLE